MSDNVAPRAGAWIETFEITGSRKGVNVAPRAGAWIETRIAALKSVLTASHPVRVRGLKLNGTCLGIIKVGSHPVRVRGLKHRNQVLSIIY